MVSADKVKDFPAISIEMSLGTSLHGIVKKPSPTVRAALAAPGTFANISFAELLSTMRRVVPVSTIASCARVTTLVFPTLAPSTEISQKACLGEVRVKEETHQYG